MKLRGIVLIACLFAWPALAAAQGYADGAGDHSVIRPAGYGWRNHVAVPDGPCGCAMPVRADCYDCCPTCGLRPLCLLRHVVRTLDCLLPCNRCCGVGYRGGPLHGCVLGNRFGCGGGCCPNPAGSCFDDIGCAARPSCGCESCTSSVPALSDPFLDDPLPPKPTAQPAHEVRRVPTPSPTRSVMMPPQRTAATRPITAPQQRTAATKPSAPPPQRTTARPNPAPQQRTAATRPAAEPRPVAAPRPTSPYKISTASTRPTSAGSNASQGLSPPAALRQTSHERAIPEPAPHWIDQSQATPIVRSQSPPETPADLEIPFNPLRAR